MMQCEQLSRVDSHLAGDILGLVEKAEANTKGAGTHNMLRYNKTLRCMSPLIHTLQATS